MIGNATIHIKLIKYYLDVSKHEQKKRLRDRVNNPFKQWKVSPIDSQAIKCWKRYSAARNEMFMRSHNPLTPWTIVRADDKRKARLNVIRDLLVRLSYQGKDEELAQPDPKIISNYDPSCLRNGMLAK